MYITHCPIVIHCQIGYDYEKKKLWPDHKFCQKPYKFDLEFKGQRLIGVKNERDTSFHGDIPI